MLYANMYKNILSVLLLSGRQIRYRNGVGNADAQASNQNSIDDVIRKTDNKRFSGITSGLSLNIFRYITNQLFFRKVI